MIDKTTTLQVNEIFETISGEAGGFPQGTWLTVVRLQGCNLACSWCDTPRGQAYLLPEQHTEQTVLEIMLEVKEFHNKHVMVTGGEPLLQKGALELLRTLGEQGYKVQVETNGSLPLPIIPAVHWVVDYKCPSSYMEHRMPPLSAFSYQLSTLQRIQRQRQEGSCCIKFVVADDKDTDYALQVINYLIKDGTIVPFLISPINADGSKIPDIVKKVKSRDINLINYITFSAKSIKF